MLSSMFQSLIAPRYPRRYVGRHRARFTMSIVTRFSTTSGVPMQRRADSADEVAA